MENTDEDNKMTGAQEYFVGIFGLIWGVESIFAMAIRLFALYLAFKCNGGFDLGGFLLACCCAPCYVVYQMAVNYKKCLPGGIKNIFA